MFYLVNILGLARIRLLFSGLIRLSLNTEILLVCLGGMELPFSVEDVKRMTKHILLMTCQHLMLMILSMMTSQVEL